MRFSPGMRTVHLVKIKRHRIGLKRLTPEELSDRHWLARRIPWEVDFGHWWFQIGDPFAPGSESYGWWPKQQLSGSAWWKIRTTLLGTEGELNGQSDYQGLATRDPYHLDDSPDVEFHPVVPADDLRSDEEIADCLRRFAVSYHGGWGWTLGLGQNCHSFQRAAMRHCGVYKP